MIHNYRTNSVEISESPLSGGKNSEDAERNGDNRADSSVGAIMQEKELLTVPPIPPGVFNVESETTAVAPRTIRPIGAYKSIEKAQAT